MLAPMIIYAFTYSNGYAIQLLMRVGNILQYTARKHNNYTYRKCKKMYLLQHFSNILALRIKHNKVRKKRRTFTTFYFPDNFWQGLAQISHFTSRYISILWATLVYLYFMCPLFLEIPFRYSNLFSSYFPKYIFILHIYTLIYTYRYRSKKK